MNTPFRSATIACIALLACMQHCSAGAAVHFSGRCSININQQSRLETATKIGLAIGAAGLATYGLVKLGCWLFGKSDESAVEAAQKNVREASAQYANITNILNKAYAGSTDIQSCITDVSEPILYELAKAKYHDADIKLYIKRLHQTIQKLEKQSQDLHKRIQNALSEPTPSHASLRLVARMKAAENTIQALLPLLYFAYEYLNHHIHYFALFETEDAMMYRYERDLHAIESYQGDLHYLQDMVHQSVMLYQRRHHDPYPYRWYVKRLEEDIYTLHSALEKLSYTYTNRFTVATDLYNKLEKIREIMISSSYYLDELRAYEYARLAQAAIEAQQMQSLALQQQTYEIQRENELRAQALQQQANTQIFVM